MILKIAFRAKKLHSRTEINKNVFRDISGVYNNAGDLEKSYIGRRKGESKDIFPTERIREKEGT